MQDMLVLLAFIAALWFLSKHFYKQFAVSQTNSCGGGCKKCEHSANTNTKLHLF